MFQTLITSIENNVLTITINRPEKLNALNKNVFADLDKALDDIEKNPEIRSAIITGAGPKAFVAGADISEFSDYSKEQAMAMAKRGQDIFLRIERCNKPIIAAVAAATGLAVIACCDAMVAIAIGRSGRMPF